MKLPLTASAACQYLSSIRMPLVIEGADLHSASSADSTTALAGVADLHSAHMCDSAVVAAVQGGGLYLRGLQLDKLGQGNVAALSSSIANNTAQFGGGVACVLCRAFFHSTNMTGNTAVRLPRSAAAAAAVTGNDSAACNSSSESRGGGSSRTCTPAEQQQQQQRQSVTASMERAVQGSGGAIAALLNDRSFLRVCSDQDAAPAALTDNAAEIAGGLVYMSYQGTTTCSSSINSSSCSWSATQSRCADYQAAEVSQVEMVGNAVCVVKSTRESRSQSSSAAQLCLLPKHSMHCVHRSFNY